MRSTAALASPEADAAEASPTQTAVPRFAQIYEEHFDYVWRIARRLGADAASLDDVAQDVFTTVHRRLPDFEARSSIRTWIYGITLRVVRDYHRRARRKPSESIGARDPADGAPSPEHHAEQAEQRELLMALLSELDDDKREALVLCELEQLSAPEIAEVLELNVNTVYARIRAARQAFDAAVRRHLASTRRIER